MKGSVFVYEHLSGGPADGPEAADPALLPEGLAMRDAIVADLLQGGDCAVTVAQRAGIAQPAPPGATLRLTQPGDQPADVLAEAAREHEAVWVVAPETGGLLARYARAVPAARWIGCSAAAVQWASSKQTTLARLQAEGVVTPLAFAQEAQRWVVKPDDGAGGLATRLYPGEAAARADAAARPEAPSVEPWVEGEPMSLSLLGGAHAAHLLSVNRQRIRVEPDGQLHFDGVELDVMPRQDARRTLLGAMAHKVMRALPGLRGFFGIDFVWHPRRGPVAIEVNPRVTSAFVGLSAVVGRSVGAAVLAAHREGRGG